MVLLSSNTKKTVSQPKSAEGDFLEMAKVLARNENISVTEAMRRVHKENPGLRQRWLEKQKNRVPNRKINSHG